MEKKSNHLSEIDGIRGWAALVVVLFHCFSEMLKNVVPEVTSNMLAPAFAGNYAVLIFFVLSGDALSASFHKSGSQSSVDRLLVRRYFRLTIPIFMSCCLTYFIIKLGVDFHKRAAVILNRNDWLGEFLDFNVSLFFLIKYSLMNVYTSHTRTESLNPFLWTMSIEIIGSMIVFLYCYAWERLKRPAILCLVLAIILSAMGSFYSLFFGGKRKFIPIFIITIFNFCYFLKNTPDSCL
jgi:peptidoglycan/LPS O-acetylase OafA/YrhL